MADLASQRLHAVVSASSRLRDEALADLLAGWTGPIRRVTEPADPRRLALDLDTPALFGEAALWVMRCDERWLKKHRDVFAAMVGRDAVNGAVVLVAPALDPREDRTKALTKALGKVGTLHEAPVPDDKAVADWLALRLRAHPQGVEQPRQVAEALIAHVGGDVDALLCSVDVLAIHADAGAITPAGVEAVASGTGERPIWEMTGALLDGDARRAIELLHAGRGTDAQPAFSALVAELRKLIACSETRDDAAAAQWCGTRSSRAMYYARRRADALGRATLLRLLTGAYLAQRQSRLGGDDELGLEMLVLHAQRVARPNRR